jgi:hypothetical protein
MVMQWCMNFGQFADNMWLVIILDNIGRSEYASSRAVQVSDKSFSGDDMIMNKIPMLLDLTINKKMFETLSSIKYYIIWRTLNLKVLWNLWCQQFKKS